VAPAQSVRGMAEKIAGTEPKCCAMRALDAA
jgi:hypothetical protein